MRGYCFITEPAMVVYILHRAVHPWPLAYSLATIIGSQSKAACQDG